jgi:glyoxylase-like metal-dependent hydrolase (beta-lactamase superfamily II)
VFCRLRDRDLVIAGDAIYTMRQLTEGAEPAEPADRHNWRRSRQELQLFVREFPNAVIVPGHDPDFWSRLEGRYE